MATIFVAEHSHSLLSNYKIPCLLSNRNVQGPQHAHTEAMRHVEIRKSQIMEYIVDKTKWALQGDTYTTHLQETVLSI